MIDYRFAGNNHSLVFINQLLNHFSDFIFYGYLRS
jgi:hypothetical protein